MNIDEHTRDTTRAVHKNLDGLKQQGKLSPELESGLRQIVDNYQLDMEKLKKFCGQMEDEK